jgi:hypothetical protein
MLTLGIEGAVADVLAVPWAKIVVPCGMDARRATVGASLGAGDQMIALRPEIIPGSAPTGGSSGARSGTWRPMRYPAVPRYRQRAAQSGQNTHEVAQAAPDSRAVYFTAGS